MSAENTESVDKEQDKAAIERPSEAIYEWTITVRKVGSVNGRYSDYCPMTVLAPTASAVTAKVREAFEATNYGVRDTWSHTWTVQSVREV